MAHLSAHPERHLVERVGWLRAAVLGANDGIVSTASLILGVAAAATGRSEVLLAGAAGLVAGAMSMAAGEYVSVSSQSDTERADLARETRELEQDPEAERDELAAIYVTRGLDQAIATCVYVVHDPRERRCTIANAGHLPPARVRAGHAPELLELPTGVPLGVGGVAFSTTTVELEPGDRLVLYTDGLVETRRHPLDERLDRLLSLLDHPGDSLEEVCDLLLRTLHEPDNFDDVALLIARATTPAP